MEQFFVNPFAILAIVVLALPRKALVLWRAAKRGEKKWFAALLVINTLAVLEIIYIFFFSKRGMVKNDNE